MYKTGPRLKVLTNAYPGMLRLCDEHILNPLSSYVSYTYPIYTYYFQLFLKLCIKTFQICKLLETKIRMSFSDKS